MKEDQILFQISRIIGASTTFLEALEQTRALLEPTLGALALTIALPQRMPSRTDVAQTHVEQILEAVEAPYRSLYAVPLRSGGKELGKLIACYASEEFHGAIPQRVSHYVGEQLGMLLDRTLLHKDRGRLEAALARMREELTARKVLQRAQGILTARHSMSAGAAKRWIAHEARKSALSVRVISEQIIGSEIEQRKAEFWGRRRRIA